MIVHRYVGVVMGLLMLVWFASGVAMLFVHWPEVTEAERAAGLAPLTWGQCCHAGDIQDVQQVTAATVEDLAGRPVLRFDGQTQDLTTGAFIHEVSGADASRIAETYARAIGVPVASSSLTWVDRDQWTVTGYFDKRRPFWVLHAHDPARTEIYVSAHTGQVSQVTTRVERILNWLGPIPHWLYPQVLRANTAVWTQVVIWTSLIGIFLTLTGLYLGFVAWRPWRDARLSPFRGLMAWHHLAGLATGILTLTWVASGLVSMNPWGFLESGSDERPGQLAGAFSHGDLRQAIGALRDAGVTGRQIKAAPLADRLYLMVDGVRFDSGGRPAPLAAADLAVAAARMGPARSASLITEEDAYYRGHHQPVSLPVYRVEMADGVRFYIDPASGQVLGAVDAPARSYRWLLEGVHGQDVVRGFDRGAGWAAAMAFLLGAAGLGVATGVWLGWRRAKADVAGLFRRRRG
ncbi:hypothetical protein [uncultured Phenylobacterium sp.]|uniref:hypothetical protein n=1 Tax=uncultured Phenylobacterium sp. TaxID=349273 RepID=UPI0025FD9EE8|nr:hypothetical protein [uncultured Phenylobacterium sp.]